MTVSSTNSRVQYQGDGATKPFAYGISFFAPADLSVTLFDQTANAAIVPAPVLNGAGTFDYTVTGVQDPNTGEYLAGATITFNTAPLGNYLVTIARNMGALQPNVYTNNSAFPAKSIEGALDRLTMVVQQEQDLLSRSITIPSSDPIATSLILPPALVRANMALLFDASGNAIAGGVPSVPVSGAMTAVFQAASIAAALAALGITPVFRNYTSVPILSNDGVTPNTKIDVTAGLVADDTGTVMIPFAAGSVDCTTVGLNGLDTGALAINTWYHVFAICKPFAALPGLIASTSLTAPTYPAGYTLKRRIGSFKTDGSGHIIAFTQVYDRFTRVVPVEDVNNVTIATSPGTVLTLNSVPPGIAVWADFQPFLETAVGAGDLMWFSSIDQTDAAGVGSTQADLLAPVAGIGTSSRMLLRTSAVQTIRARSAPHTNGLNILTHGWLDPLGRFA